MKWIKKWMYVILLLTFGVIFLGYSGEWKRYPQAARQVSDWYEQQEWAWMPAFAEQTGDPTDDGQQEPFEETVAGADVENVLAEDPPTGELPMEGNPSAEEAPPLEEVPQTWRDPAEILYKTVEDDYFADAVFIGDSRTVGMFEYGGLEEIADFYASTGLTVYKIFDSPVVEVPEQREKQTIEEALSQQQFAKIYLMIGINEMGTGTVESFIEKYRQVLVHLQELQPDAVIYLQGIMKVTTERSEQGDYITNEGIEARNTEIEKLADNMHVYYLDVNPLICDESGGMESSYTYDGVHLKAQYISIWKDYLKTHAIENIP